MWEKDFFSLFSLCRERAHQAILLLCKSAMKFRTISEAHWDWLYVVPLCDFLSGATEPFAGLQYKSTLVGDVRVKTFGYEELRHQIIPGYCYT